ncbi:MAG TPA: RidA family protein [Candidatus Binatia bacterium]|jgi:2-iminobutanoate/2-iminopropanoate deaminase
MEIKEITPSEYKVPKRYWRGVTVGDFVLLSGTAGIDPETDTVLPTIEEQAEMVYQRIVRSLKVAGTAPEYVIRRTTYLVDPHKNIGVTGAIEKKYLPFPKASSTVGVTALARPGMLIEVDIIAIKPPKKPKSPARAKTKRGRSKR